MQKIKVAILGCGSRGATAYGQLIHERKEQFAIVSLCDVDEEALALAKTAFSVADDNVFLNEDAFFAKKRADLLVIATPDKEHVRQALQALQLGYHLLLEKPVSDNVRELKQLLKAQKKYGKKVFVCHVLRYAPAFLKAKKLLEEGAIGRLVAINAIERVAYWHDAHSYVRGNWRDTKKSTPMILAKCCHDLDLLQYYADSPCISVSSIGDLTFFKTENAPSNSTNRCVDCPQFDGCVYSAKWYLDAFESLGKPENIWPFNVVTKTRPVTQEALQTAIEKGAYGRCVFQCDNNAVDHQLTSLAFANGVKATLTMMGFTADGGRVISFYGTHGEMLLEDVKQQITVRPFGKEQRVIPCEIRSGEGGHSHGGGDYAMIEKLYAELTGEHDGTTSLSESVESHLIGFYAERSRKLGGKCIKIRKPTK